MITKRTMYCVLCTKETFLKITILNRIRCSETENINRLNVVLAQGGIKSTVEKVQKRYEKFRWDKLDSSIGKPLDLVNI